MRRVSSITLSKGSRNPVGGRLFSTLGSPGPVRIGYQKVGEQGVRDVFHEWAKREFWNPGKHEWKPCFAADQQGYSVLTLDGEPAACLAGVKYSDRLAFLGLYIVRPDLRKSGFGYGKLLWDITMGRLDDVSTLALNGVEEQVETYKKSGFAPEHKITRWQGRVALDKLPPIRTGTRLVEASECDLDVLSGYDSGIFSESRRVFLQNWIQMPESKTLVSMDADGGIAGYGVVSRTVEGYKIAPLFAKEEETAKAIYAALCRFVGEDKLVQIDTIEPTDSSARLAQDFGLERVFDVVRMYKGEPPEVGKEEIFGLTSLEIG